MLAVYMVCLGPEGYRQKAIGVTVVYADATTDEFSLALPTRNFCARHWRSRSLSKAKNPNTVQQKTVNGVTADEAKEEWWCFTKDGEDVMTGVDSPPWSRTATTLRSR